MTTVPPAFPDDTPEDPARSVPLSGPSDDANPAADTPASETSPNAEQPSKPAAAAKSTKPRTPAKPRSTSTTAAKKKPAARTPKASTTADKPAAAETPDTTDAGTSSAPSRTPPKKPATRTTSASKPRASTKKTATPADAPSTSGEAPVESEAVVPVAKPVRQPARKSPTKSTATKKTTAKKPAATPPVADASASVDGAILGGTEPQGEPSVTIDAPQAAAEPKPQDVPAAAEPKTNDVPAVADLLDGADTETDVPDAAVMHLAEPSAATKKPAPRKQTGAKSVPQRPQVAAAVAKSSSDVVERVAPKNAPEASSIPPVPPLPVVPPVPPLPTDVPPVPPLPDDLAPAEELTDLPNGDVADVADAVDTPATVLDTESPDEPEMPPLPDMTPEEAALRSETMPDAAEQATGLESHEPMKFAWSKRWPFLSLVPVTQAPEARKAEETAEFATQDGSDSVVELSEVDGSDVDELEVLDETETEGEDVEPAELDGTDSPATVVTTADDAAVLSEAPSHEDVSLVVEASIADTNDVAPSNEEIPGASAAESTALIPDADVAHETMTYPVIDDESMTEVIPTSTPDAIGHDAPSDDVATELLTKPTSEWTLDDEPVVLPEPTVELDDRDATALGEPPVVLSIRNLSRSFGDTIAVNGIDLDVREGSFYGIVGPNGAGKTTTLSMITGLLRPDSGNITVHGIDVWENPDKAKRAIGVLPDRLRLFDRLTGAQLLYYSGVLRGLDGATVRSRVTDLAAAFGLEDALNRLVTDYSAGMTKKVALASAMIHSPRLLVLDEPFESVDPVSAANVIEILQKYVAHGGTVVLSSHGMDLIQRVCDHVAIVVNGQVLAAGAVDEVRGNGTLEDRFVELAGGRKAAEGMEWLHSFSD